MSLFSEKKTARLDIGGMHCKNCVARVTEALEAVEGVTAVEVNLEDGAARVEGRGFEETALEQAVAEAGFAAAISAE